MNYISDILYWISTGLLVPVIVLLIILFGRSVLLLGNFFGQYLAIRKTDAHAALTTDNSNNNPKTFLIVSPPIIHMQFHNCFSEKNVPIPDWP